MLKQTPRTRKVTRLIVPERQGRNADRGCRGPRRRSQAARYAALPHGVRHLNFEAASGTEQPWVAD
jgi:hypothetical protein